MGNVNEKRVREVLAELVYYPASNVLPVLNQAEIYHLVDLQSKRIAELEKPTRPRIDPPCPKCPHLGSKHVRAGLELHCLECECFT